MKKNAKLMAVLTLFSLVFVIIITSFALSAFSVNSNINLGFGSGEVKYETSGVSLDGPTTFATPGDSVTKTFSIKNTGDTPFKYTMSINLKRSAELATDEVGIENAIFVHIDGEYLGRLNELTSDKYTYAPGFALTPTDKTEHKITFEYHIDADTNYTKNIQLDVDVKAVSALNYDGDYVFVNNYNALQQYARKSNYQGRTIVLTNDITLEKNVALKVNCNIDLNSHKLNLNGHTLSIAGTGINEIVRIENRVDADPLRAVKGFITGNSNANSSFVINTPNGLVIDNTKCDSISLATGGYSNAMLHSSYLEYLESITKDGVIGNTDISGGYGIYFKTSANTPLRLTSTSSTLSVDVVGTVATMKVTRIDLTQDEPLLVTASALSKQVSVRIWGNDDDATVERYLSGVIGFTNNYSSEKKAYIVSSDIFLPTHIQSLGAQIVWRTSNPNVVSTAGKTNRPYKEAESSVELSAYITYNGVTSLKTYSLYIYKKTADDILKEIIYELESKLTFAYVYESKDNENVRELVTAEQYAHLGVTKLEYLDLASQYQDIFDLDKTAPSLELTKDTVISKAALGIKIEVTDDLLVDNATGEARIIIDINRNANIFDAMYNHLLTYISHIEKNTLESFEVPTNYIEEINSYKYYIFPGKKQIPETENEYTINPLDVNNYIKVSADQKSIVIDKYKAPNENTTVTVLVELKSNGQTVYRTMKIDVTGVLLLGRDIMDDNLFYKLKQVIDGDSVHGNHDGFISRDEIDAIGLTSFTQTESYIHSLLGLEYFTTLENLNLSSNEITDISPLASLTNLTSLDLSKNRIINVSKIETLTNLETLNLSSNEIIDISNLTYLQSLKSLSLDNNLGIIDLAPIVNMEHLSYLTIYNTAASNPANLKFNLNYLITQHDKIGYNNAFFYVSNSTTVWHPTTNEQKANIIVNYIEPIEEIGQVIVLPSQIEFDGITYPIYWETTPSSAGIITIDDINHRAYVKQPIADINITLHAYIKYGDSLNPTIMYRVMDILSRGKNVTLSLTLADGVTTLYDDEIRDAIPDATLLQFLYDKYGEDNAIDISQLIANGANGVIDLSGSKIKSFEGIELFKDVITSLNVSNVYIEDFTPITDLKNLNTLIATAGNLDVSKLVGMEQLNYLYIYGCVFIDESTGLKMDEYEALKNLYLVYKDNSSSGIRIYQDSSSEWNPYITPTMDALTAIQSIYVVSVGKTTYIPTNIVINMYGVENIPVSIATPGTNGPYKFEYVLGVYNSATLPTTDLYTLNRTNGELTLANNKVPPQDIYSVLTVTLTIKNASTSETVTTCKRNILVMQLSEKNMHVELADGSFLPFEEVFEDYELGRAVTALYDGRKTTINGVQCPYIAHSQIMGITSITLDGAEGGSLKGLEQFYGSTSLTTINCVNLRSPGYGMGERMDLSVLNDTNFPALVNLNFTSCYVYLPDLLGLTSLETLNILDAIRVDVGNVTSFAAFENLHTLRITNSEVIDFSFIATLPCVANLYIYNNYASKTEATNGYVMNVYNNLMLNNPASDYDYYVVSNLIKWTPVDVSRVYEYGVYATTSSGTEVYVDLPGNPGIYSPFDAIDNISYVKKGDYIYLPTNWNGNTITWTSTSPYLMDVANAPVVIMDGLEYYKITVNALNVKSYARLSGTLFKKILIYAFVIEENGETVAVYDTVNEGYIKLVVSDSSAPTALRDLNGQFVVDLNVFMVDGVVEDPVFMNYMLSATNGYKNTNTFALSISSGVTLQATNYTGVFTKTNTANLLSADYRYSQTPKTLLLGPNLSAQTEYSQNFREHRFTSIRGIKVFYALKSVNFVVQEISDLSELRFLTLMTTLDISQTKVTTLWYLDTDGKYKSIFANNTALTSFTGTKVIIDNDDYCPLFYKDYELTTTRTNYKLIATMFLEQNPTSATGSYHGYTNGRSLDKVFDLYKDNTALTTIKLAYTQYTTTSITLAGMRTLADDMAKFMRYEPAARTYKVNDTLPADTIGTRTVYWETVGTGSLIKIDASGKITSDGNNINGPVLVAGYIMQSGTRALVRHFIIQLEDARSSSSKIWISETEATTFQSTIIDGAPYYPSSAITQDEGGLYYVDGAYAIPDMSLRNSLFVAYDTNNDGTISQTERNATTHKYANPSSTYGLNLMSKGIQNIRGIELFPNLNSVLLAGNDILAVPKLMWPANHTMSHLFIGVLWHANNRDQPLRDISNLVFDADGSGTAYKAVSMDLKYLDISSAPYLLGDQFLYLTNTNFDTNPNSPTYMQYKLNYSALTTIQINGTKFTDYRYFPYLPQTMGGMSYAGPASSYIGSGSLNTKETMIYWDKFVLNTAYASSNKSLAFTKLQYEIPFDEAYVVGGPAVQLPSEVTIYGETYKLGYTLINTATVKLTTTGGNYYLQVLDGADAEISIVAFTHFKNPANPTQWIKSCQETVKVKTSAEEGGGEETEVILCEGTIQLTDGGPYEDMRLYIKDPQLRYWFLSHLDRGGQRYQAIRDGKISYSELLDITRVTERDQMKIGEYATGRYVSDLTGISILGDFGMKKIMCEYLNMSNLDEFAKVKSLTYLGISENMRPIYDLSFINELPNLKDLYLRSSFYVNMNFLHTNTTLERLNAIDTAGISSGSRAVDAQYIHTEWAYARANGKLSEYESYMLYSGGHNQNFVSSSAMKTAAEVLNKLTFAFDTPLAESVTYNGKVYGNVAGAVENTSLKFVSVCGGIDINSTTRIATNNGTREIGLVLAILEYQGAFYERLFIVEL